MKIGFCAKPGQLSDMINAGYDYMEPPVNAIAAMTPEDFEDFARKVKEAKLSTPSFNLLFPKTLSLLKRETRDSEIADYLSLAFERVRRLGGSLVVFGSGKSRNRPDGISYGEAFLRLADVCRMAAQMAEQHGLTIAIEALNRTETNMICSLPEAADLAAVVSHPCLKVLADYYHIRKEFEPIEEIIRIGGVIHAHIATEEGRLAPVSEEPAFSDFFKALKQTGYEGNLSVEGKCEHLGESGPVTAALLRKLWEEA